MNDHEAERIAAAMHQLRPDWPAASIRTLIRKKLQDRPRRDVTVALAWVACESGTSTPARVLEAGPWWKAAAVDGVTGPRPAKVDRKNRCTVCSLHRDECAQRWADDHKFTSIRDSTKADPSDTWAETRQAVKAARGKPIESRPPRSLDEMTSGPRVQALKAEMAAARVAAAAAIAEEEPA